MLVRSLIIIYILNLRLLIDSDADDFVYDFIPNPQLQVFFDLMREIRSRKTEDSKATSGRAKDRCKKRRLKCTLL